MQMHHKDLPVLEFKTQQDLENWMTKNHKQEQGFWLKYYKKHTNKLTIQHSEAVDTALCWGWIDGLINRLDEESYAVRFTPRRPKSVWSKVNVANVERLTKEGRMKPSGLAHVETAIKDGRWNKAYSSKKV